MDAESMMSRSVRTALVPLLLLVIPPALAYAWGLSWALGDFPQCGQGIYFLADLGWLVGGMLLGLLVGIVVPVTLALRRSFLLAVPVLVAAGFGMLVAADAGAARAARLAGCEVWGDVAEAGHATLMGLAVGAVPSVLFVGVIVGIGWFFRPGRRA
jgi:hypothetical protein